MRLYDWRNDPQRTEKIFNQRLNDEFDQIALTNVRLAKTGAYSVANTDRAKTIALGGSAFYALTFSAASGYDANFFVVVLNEDTGRAKYISLSGGTSFYLWPGQTAFVYNSNNAWQALRPGRWKAPTGTLNFYSDFTNGSDTAGAADGLATGSSAFKTAQKALSVALDQIDFTGDGQTAIVVNMAASTTDTTGVHFSGHAWVGAQGGAAVKILGGSSSKITTTGTDALAFFCNIQVQVSGIELSTVTSGNCINADLGAQVDIQSGMTFGACAGSHISSQKGARVYRNAAYTISGSAATAHMICATNGIIGGGGVTVTVSADITVTWFAIATVFAAISAPGDTYSLGGHTVTGQRYEADNLSLIYTSGGGATYFPGTVGGSTSGGGQYV